ncbi:hypothetical protein FGG08_002484 [Glutinoglossum americanum]|uniref:Uncharacterized protein n=1 Tax=Glutinoglossum americanum TaxID=1670608 RepID=A0A9P8L4F3_9PEZI|nr:hypothetical protein FGG08_002484 [Glutinoglossum americanum]
MDMCGYVRHLESAWAASEADPPFPGDFAPYTSSLQSPRTGRDPEAGRAHSPTERIGADVVATTGPQAVPEWRKYLDDDSAVVVTVYEYRYSEGGTSSWHSYSVSQVRDLLSPGASDPPSGEDAPEPAHPEPGRPLLPEPVQARLYLIEGLSSQTISVLGDLQLGLPADFFGNHCQENLPNARPKPELHRCFFAKWSRTVHQDHEQWEIERKIAAGWPYDVDTLTHPERLLLDHKKYERSPLIFRSYDPLDPQIHSQSTPPYGVGRSEGTIRHAARTCVSFYHDPMKSCFTGMVLATPADPQFENTSLTFAIGVLIFDAPHKHLITDKKYDLWRAKETTGEEGQVAEPCFRDDIPSRERFIAAFEEQNTGPHNLRRRIMGIITQIMLSDQMDVFSHLSEAVRSIDLAMSHDNMLHNHLQSWRQLFGSWRHGLSSTRASIDYVLNTMKIDKGKDREGADDGGADPSALEEEFGHLSAEVDFLWGRIESTFQALMSTMAIVEHRAAIQQAAEISKLTRLAFLFIPLSFVAALFGMNIGTVGKNLKLWIWAVVSVSVTGAAYATLYMTDILSLGRRVPTNLSKSYGARKINLAAKRWILSTWFALKTAYRAVSPITATLLVLGRVRAILAMLVIQGGPPSIGGGDLGSLREDSLIKGSKSRR